MVKRTSCSYRGPELVSQHPHNSCSQLPITPDPEDLRPSSGLPGHQTYMCHIYIHTYMQANHKDKIKIKLKHLKKYTVVKNKQK